jgi:hypothetical protein
MNMAIMVPLSALVVWFGALYIENKFGTKFTEKPNGKTQISAPAWKRVIWRNAAQTRLGGLFLLWIGVNLAVAFQRGEYESFFWISIGVASVGTMIYMVAMLFGATGIAKKKSHSK